MTSADGLEHGGPTRESDIERTIRANDPALIAYLTAGDPALERTASFVEALDRGGTDLIELGMPFSEPIAEGPTIQAAIQRALTAGTTPEGVFELIDGLDVDAPLAVMTYYNVIFQYGPSDEPGVEAFTDRATEVGLSGLIVPDLPAEEAGPLLAACRDRGIDLVFIVAPTTTDDRLDRIMTRTSGFAYVQARLGTTGARADVSTATHESLQRLVDYDVPKAVGFGVSEAEHAAELVAAGADGVIVGSALVDLAARAEEPVTALESKAAELKAGAVSGLDERAGTESVPEPEHP